MDFFQQLSELLKPNSRVSLAITKTKEGRLAVTIHPEKFDDDGKSEQNKILPLVFTGTAEQLDANFFDNVGKTVTKAMDALFPNQEAVDASIEDEKEENKPLAKTSKKATEKLAPAIKSDPAKDYIDQLTAGLELRDETELTKLITSAATNVKLYPKKKKEIETLVNQLKTVKLKLANGMFSETDVLQQKETTTVPSKMNSEPELIGETVVYEENEIPDSPDDDVANVTVTEEQPEKDIFDDND